MKVGEHYTVGEKKYRGMGRCGVIAPANKIVHGGSAHGEAVWCAPARVPHAEGAREPAAVPVCWWADDGQEDGDAAQVLLTANADLSLTEARGHYRTCGAAHPRFLRYMRKPLASEQ